MESSKSPGGSARCTSPAHGRPLPTTPMGASIRTMGAVRAVREDRAEVVCLGCGGMAGRAERVGARAGVPVVDGVTAAVTVAESLVRLGLSTSKVRTYAPRRSKTITNRPPRSGG